LKTVCVLTGTRAEYGLLRWVMDGVNASSKLKLQLIATGSHLSPHFGLTVSEIERDGFRIDRKVEMLLSSDTPVGVTKSMGLLLCGLADALVELKPDVLLLLGDRYEAFAAAAAATIANIPIAHLHGGEATEGAFDEAMRHSITKMSHLHFVAAEEYRQRVIQLGEAPERVFLVGGLGIDSIRKLSLLSRAELEAALQFRLGPRNLLVTFHPATLERGAAAAQMAELLAALETLRDTHVVFTRPNADTESQVLWDMIGEFVRGHSQTSTAIASLGQARYFSCIKHVDGVVGNSSSGLIEVPALGKGTVNIGDRQRGRLRAGSVIDCAPLRADIVRAISRLYAQDFQSSLKNVASPYGAGGASEKVVQILERSEFGSLLKKRFHDLPVAALTK
jgi:GDP/UDP-N,N'-diacetylbacillosamine 2-epimerase (hydrolysing)